MFIKVRGGNIVHIAASYFYKQLFLKLLQSSKKEVSFYPGIFIRI